MNSFEDPHQFPQAYKNLRHLTKCSDVLLFMLCSTACDNFIRISCFSYGFDILRDMARTSLASDLFQHWLKLLDILWQLRVG